MQTVIMQVNALSCTVQ